MIKFFRSLGSWIYNRLAGSRFLRRIALQQYKKAIFDKHGELHIPFRPTRPLDMHEIYVPLKLVGSVSNDQIDAYNSIAGNYRLMVLGSPGSGKSMLLKHIALDYAENRFVNLPDKPIPVLLELHRLNGNTTSLEQHLVAELARNDFPHADRFVSHSLKHGTLMLLLDGLDEVNSNERGRVIQQIKDMLEENRKCRAIITCRTVIYKGEFIGTVDQTLEIVEFSDQQIRNFLRSWAPDMPSNKSIEQLMQTLHDRPRIMALARNPLLLTIIAYLYTDTPYMLPLSRAEFYRQSTDVLLRQWHQERNQFEACDKRLILEHLGLFFQDSANQRQQDRRSVEYQTVLNQVRKVLPGLNLRPEQDAYPILKEIVERSGLLLSIDNGERYQFAHLTLQEFFAASELIDDAEGLVSRFKVDYDAWRETVKLWCGLTGDSTALIKKIYADNPIAAFECLSDAQKIDPKLADEIIEAFKDRLGAMSDDDIITQAFGTVASDLRPRGAKVFDFLKEALNIDESVRQTAAAKALSLTNLPQAAKVLGEHYSLPGVRASLARMGDIAVPELRRMVPCVEDYKTRCEFREAMWDGKVTGVIEIRAESKIAVEMVREHRDEAMDDLLFIGTPQAAEALIPLLWSIDKSLEESTAWRVAALLSKPDVEAALRGYELSEEQKKAERIEWIWEPFADSSDSALPIIAGRIGYLLDHATFETAPNAQLALDPRIVIPLVSIQHPNEIKAKEFDSPNRDRKPSTIINYIDEFINKIDNQSFQYLLRSLTYGQLHHLFLNLKHGPQPTRDDWFNIFRPLKYEFYKSWHYRAILIFFIITYFIAIGSVNMINLYGVIISVIVIPYILLFTYLFSLKEKKRCMRKTFPLTSFSFGLIFILKAIKYAQVSLLDVFSWQFLVLFWLTLMGTCLVLWLVGKQHERKAQNPLYGIFDAEVG